MKSFQYAVPGSVDEACALLFDLQDTGKPLAGGTDLLVKIKQGVLRPAHLVSLGGLKELNHIRKDNGVIRIGAMTPLQEVTISELVRRNIPILSEAASQVGCVQVRNRGTLGGNICNASPAADTVSPLICLDGTIHIRSSSGARETRIEDFFIGPGEVHLQPGELVTEVIVPIPDRNAKGVYLKLGRRKAMDISIVGVACLGIFGGGRCEAIRLTLASVAPTPLRAKKAEKTLEGEPVDADRIVSAADQAASECHPISDVRGSASYRKQMVKALVEKAIRSVT